RFGIAINKIGIRVSMNSYSSLNPISIDNYSQVYTDSIITDTVNWTKITGSFIADSAYSFFSIGNFFVDSLTSSISFDSAAWYSYYYIDDIKLSTDSNFVNSVDEHNTFSLIQVFPNPARDWISIRGNDIKSVALYDVLGRKVYSNSVVISPILIDMSSFSNGLYFLESKTKSDIVINKIILQ